MSSQSMANATRPLTPQQRSRGDVSITSPLRPHSARHEANAALLEVERGLGRMFPKGQPRDTSVSITNPVPKAPQFVRTMP